MSDGHPGRRSRHTVMFSGGAGSWATAKRVAERHGTEGMVLLFTDTKGEDPELYKVLPEWAENVGAPLVVAADGRDIWQVFRDDQMLGSAFLANCSKFLKQRVARKWLEENTDFEQTTVYVGIDWSESHRLAAISAGYEPWPVEAPMAEKPYLSKADMLDWMDGEGLRRPKLYAEGFSHNNCAGACVRGGQAHWALLLRTHRDRYLYAEGKEQELRDYLGKDVSILRDRAGGVTRPLTLRAFRTRLEAQGDLFDHGDWGACGCLMEAA